MGGIIGFDRQSISIVLSQRTHFWIISKCSTFLCWYSHIISLYAIHITQVPSQKQSFWGGFHKTLILSSAWRANVICYVNSTITTGKSWLDSIQLCHYHYQYHFLLCVSVLSFRSNLNSHMYSKYSCSIFLPSFIHLLSQPFPFIHIDIQSFSFLCSLSYILIHTQVHR